MSTRIRDQLAQPARVAVERKRLGVGFDAHVAFDRERRKAAGGIERHLAQVRRLDRELEGARIGAREEEQIVDQGAESIGLRLDVVEGIADVGDRLVGVAAEMRHRALHDAQRGAQLVARVRGEVALAAHCVPDRDQGTLGVQPADPKGDREYQQAADGEDGEEDGQRTLLGDPVGHDLDDEGLVADRHEVRQDSDRGAIHARELDRLAAQASLVDAGRVRQLGVEDLRDIRERGVVGTDDEGERPGR